MYITNAKIFTMGEQGIIDNGYVLFQHGVIIDLGKMSEFNPVDTQEIVDAKGNCVFPGFIDAHTHLGMWEDSLDFEGNDGNEQTSPSMPHLRAIDAINPVDKCFVEALDAGITTVVTGPGSANPIGGQMVAMKTFGRRIDDMIIKSPIGIKFALGENPKRVYNEKDQTPMTRMGTVSIIREQLYKAKEYLKLLDDQLTHDDADEVEYDIKCESLIPLLKNEIKAHFHAHRADDIFTAIRIAKEFSLDYTIVHCTDGASIADVLAKEGAEVLCGPLICERSKPELKTLSPKTPGLLGAGGMTVAIITDHPVIPVQYLPLSAGLAVREGMDYYEAIKAITINPAKICGIEDRVGSVEIGKDADFAVFDGDPLSVYSVPKAVFLGGKLVSGNLN
ncbi:MAG: amidohydrolase [Oscillospiraceae bacterium]|nr:amidohydrolase [Oscillospiraceae bacterium]